MSKLSESKHTASWQVHLDAWQSSGKTQVAYCREHGLVYCQFTYWKKKLTQDITVVQGDGQSSGFVPVQLIDSRPSSLTICLPNGATIEGIFEDNGRLARDIAKALL